MTPDSYSLGGIVEELEAQCARLLGKERAIFMPTGTLANHMAVRALAGGSSRVIVQEQSHFYQDEGDCAQTLSNLTLMPLAPGRADLHRRRGPAPAGSDERRARRLARVGDRGRDAGAPEAGRAFRRRGAGEDHRDREARRHPPAPGRRAAVSAGGVYRRGRRRVREAVRHGLRFALQVLQRRVRRDPRGAARRHRRDVSRPADVRRRA